MCVLTSSLCSQPLLVLCPISTPARSVPAAHHPCLHTATCWGDCQPSTSECNEVSCWPWAACLPVCLLCREMLCWWSVTTMVLILKVLLSTFLSVEHMQYFTDCCFSSEELPFLSCTSGLRHPQRALGLVIPSQIPGAFYCADAGLLQLCLQTASAVLVSQISHK